MIYLSLGSNIGDRLTYLRQTIEALRALFTVHATSVVFETTAILPEGSPQIWNQPYCNMIIAGESSLSPRDLLHRLQEVERCIGRSADHISQAPRIIDIDILLYHDVEMHTESLTIPHKEIKNRPFLQALLALMGKASEPVAETYTPLRSFVLEPEIVGIVNITPDSFSDGGRFLDPPTAVHHMQEITSAGAAVIELGAQSTHPGYTEISPQEERARLEPVVEQYQGTACLGIDTYFDEIVDYALQKSFLWINDIKAHLQEKTIKNIADHGAKLVTMLYGTDLSWLEHRIAALVRLGMRRENIILDPGIGFGKTKRENLAFIRALPQIQNLGCPVMLAHARKSFMTSFAPYPVEDRDIETLAISQYAAALGVDYLRVHAVQEHIRFLVAQQSVTLSPKRDKGLMVGE